MINKDDMRAFENFLGDIKMKVPRKEYNDRWTAKLVNRGVTLEEYEKNREYLFYQNCSDCGKELRFKDTHFPTCFGCYQENFRRGN